MMFPMIHYAEKRCSVGTRLKKVCVREESKSSQKSLVGSYFGDNVGLSGVYRGGRSRERGGSLGSANE